MMIAIPQSEAFRQDGIAVISSVVTEAAASQRLAELPGFATLTPGTRAQVLPEIVAGLVASDGRLGALARSLMQRPARAVRVLTFDKTEAANWAVPWHQDRTIAVAERAEVPGYDVWSVKDGVAHVEPPVDILCGMVALRLHLDDCGPDNGPLLAVRGSYRDGRVATGDIAERVAGGAVAMYAARAGDVVAMRGLTIHASKRAKIPGHRRVLHVDYATSDLPAALSWSM